MDCPNCKKRDLAFLCKVDGLLDLPGEWDRLWCPACGYVVHRAVAVKGSVPLERVSTKSVPRGTSKKAEKARKRVKR